ncbi:MAG: PQQ-like beta-propeller repeat protein [Verrucomicrobia bacterium]|nr:PQQ-like beta-propeller repeat protein [Verrucomicrobiota bacterium]
MKTPLLLRTTLLFVSVVSFSAGAADWSRFRGPNGDGSTADTSIPLKWSEKENVVWRMPLPGPGSSSPIVSGTRVFLTSYSGYGATTNDPGDIARLTRHALCLDRATGKILWSHAVKATQPNKPYQGQYLTTHGYASGSAVTDGRSVFFFFANEGVFAFTMDGQPLWNVSVGLKAHDWGNGTSPILHGNLLIVNAAIESDTLFALDKTTGKTVWSVRGGFPASWNTPTLAKVGAREELIVNASRRLRAFDPATGSELWSCRGIQAAELCPSVVVRDGIAFVLGSPNGQMMAVRAGGSGDVSASHVVWEIRKGSNVGSPVVHDGHLYWANDSRGILYCAKAATGEIVFEQPLTGQRRDRIYASPILSGGRLYFVSRTSGTYVVAAKPQFELLAHNVIADDPGVCNASPAVADGQIFLRSDRLAYCIGTRR